jgi:SAM-dependent methyltransferase
MSKPTSYYNFYFSTEEIAGSAARIRYLNQLVYDCIRPHLEPETPVLELGVGKAYFAETCISKGHTFKGVEANPEQCRVLQERDIEVVCGFVPPIPVQEGEFGLIYSAHLLEHLPDSRAVHELLSDCSRLLADGGIVAMLFPDALSMGREFWNCDYTHLYPTSERRVAQALEDAGLKVIDSHGYRGHYTGAKRQLARAVSHPVFLKAANLFMRSPQRRDFSYRAWMYLQQDILLLATRP